MGLPDLRILKANSVEIPEDVSIRRVPQRPLKYRKDEFHEKFDDRTLFYDAFHDGSGQLVLVGPPLWNLGEEVRHAEYSVDGVRIETKPKIRELSRCALTSLPFTLDHPSSLDFRIFERDLHCAIGQLHTDEFAGSRVVVTKSKDNDIEWIRDWLQFYVRVHGADSVLFFDNGSTSYDCHALLDAAAGVQGLARFWVVDSPFKFGPTGGNAGIWDSDFYQLAMLSLARHRFLSKAAAVLSIDIDELVLRNPHGIGIFEATEQSETGYIHFPGRWIEAAVERYSPDNRYRHRDFTLYRTDGAASSYKWSIRPDACKPKHQWAVHAINGNYQSEDGGFLYRHFRGISTNWKYNRNVRLLTEDMPLDDDKELTDTFEEIGWRDTS